MFCGIALLLLAAHHAEGQPAAVSKARTEHPLDLPNWNRIIMPQTPILEIILRGTLTYLGVFFFLRIVLKREAGTLGMTDLLVVVMLADAIQNGMADNYNSVADGMILVATILGWSHFLNFLGFHFPFIEKLLHPAPLLLVKNGILLRRNLRKEFITEDELLSQIREQGVDSISNVSEAYMEMDGRISVLSVNSRNGNGQARRKV
jgi:uncharacterized membrane protein YcaP (DUF421 family)